MGETPSPRDAKSWSEAVRRAFVEDPGHSLQIAEQALKDYPHDASLLNLAAVAALLEERPERCLRYEKRLSKYYVPDERDQLLQALALAQQGRWGPALETLKHHGLDHYPTALQVFPGGAALTNWLIGWLHRIFFDNPMIKASRQVPRKSSPGKAAPDKKTKAGEPPLTAPATKVEQERAELPRFSPEIPVHFKWTNRAKIRFSGGDGPEEEIAWFRLRNEFLHLSLMRGFDELLCLEQLHQVDIYWYQGETVRKVLKQFRGRVLLADEVGLGKTIEAGIVLKEYMLRGMVERVLILTPASLVGQWREEMERKFDILCATSYDALLHTDPDGFWAQPRVIASIATARRKEHFERLVRQTYDLIIVDEAHHLKNRATQNYKLVDALKKRFLLLLSATPVQNSLVELYNLLTLLKPGIFKTEREFRNVYMMPGKPRVPANRDRLRDLMRDVMIRNTRALVDVRLPPRHATTLRVETSIEEGSCYGDLSRLVREAHASAPGHHRLALHHLLSAAGSSPAAAATAIHRFAERYSQDQTHWRRLHERYCCLNAGAKEQCLLEILERNPEEKKMVFVHHRETLVHLDRLFSERGIAFARFEGSMAGPDKDAAIERFCERIPVLLCTESGGEGRNVQFCNTLINFDLPWNPMAIEQRIGRVHRIGQHREVFVFNLVLRDTVEDQVLRILDEKINMFELVVGEIGAILGELEEQQDFSELIFAAWVETTEQSRSAAFAELGERLAGAKGQYEAVKALDQELFAEEFVTT